MEFSSLKQLLFPLVRSCSVVLLGILVILGWSILVLAGLELLIPYLPALAPLTTAGQTFLSGSFVAMLTYPLLVLLLLILAGYLLMRLKWDAWF